MGVSRRTLLALLSSAGAARLSAAPILTGSPINVRDFGARGDGVADDRAAFAAAIRAGRGRRIAVPQGNYLIRSDGGPLVLEEVALVGEGVLDGETQAIDRGANLWITGAKHSPFKVRRGSSLSGIGIYYPEQVDSASPRQFPAAFEFDFSAGPVQFVKFEDLVVYNAWRFIDINDPGGNVGHVEIIGNYICALNLGIYLRHNAEHFRIERNNFTYGHWLQSTDSGARGYMRANSTAVQIDESDGVEFVDNLVFGHLNGLLTSAVGLCQFIKIAENKFDEVRYGVRALGRGRFDGQVLGNTFNCFDDHNRLAEARSISVETGDEGDESIVISGNSFDLASNEHVHVVGDAPRRRLVIGPNSYRSWAAWKTNGRYGAINLAGAKTDAQVTGGWFDGVNNPKCSVGMTGKLETLQVTGASFDSCLAALDVSATEVIATGNRSSNTTGAASDLISASSITASANRWDKPSRA